MFKNIEIFNDKQHAPTKKKNLNDRSLEDKLTNLKQFPEFKSYILKYHSFISLLVQFYVGVHCAYVDSLFFSIRITYINVKIVYEFIFIHILNY